MQARAIGGIIGLGSLLLGLALASLPGAASAAGPTYQRGEVEGIVADLERRSSDFAHDYREYLKRTGRWQPHRGPDRDLWNAVQDYETAADRLLAAFRSRSDYRQAETEANTVLRLGDQVSRLIRRAEVARETVRDWDDNRALLRRLSAAYGQHNRFESDSWRDHYRKDERRDGRWGEDRDDWYRR